MVGYAVSAHWARQAATQRTISQSAAGTIKTVDASGDKVIIVPDDLAEAFRANPASADFFQTLSYTNRKEYVRWITDAKREETRSGRVSKTVEYRAASKIQPKENRSINRRLIKLSFPVNSTTFPLHVIRFSALSVTAIYATQ